MKASVLIVDDEPLIRATLKKALGTWDAELADGVAAALAALGRRRFDLAIVDLKLGDGDGLELVRRLRAEAPDTAIIVITAHGSVDNAVEAMKLGAYDFLRKPFELDEILATAANATRVRQLERRVRYHQNRDRARVDETINVTVSPAMRTLERELGMIAGQPVPITLVTGETGAGKAVLARRLHVAAGRDGDFVELNVAAVPESLVESELFGYERGAFSDARDRKPGLVEVADGGTLFLDEIGELSPAAQAKLLGFLDGFSFRRLGATAMQTVDVRVVAATNRDLKALADAGRFRADLYFRLSALTLRVPALRERADDLVPLAEHFVTTAAQRYGRQCRGVSPEAATALRGWRWPGNVRELKAVIDRAVLMNDGVRLELNHLPSELVAASIDPVPTELHADAALPTLEEVELRYMRAVLALMGGNKVRTAERLGISRQTLAKRLGESE
jgi:two-component system response regulator AtoC